MVVQGALFNHAWYGLDRPCPLCQHPEDTLYHRLWHCPEMLKHHPIPRVWESHVADNSYWCRGIPPKSIYEVPGGGLEQVTGTGLWEPLQPIPTTNLVFGTDGSGGPASKDKRLRVQLCSSCLRQGHLARSGHPQRQHPRHPDSAPSRSHSTPLPSQVHHWTSGKQH